MSMENLLKIVLKGGAILLVNTESQWVRCINRDSEHEHMTRAIQLMICILAQNLNTPVRSLDLYNSYSGENATENSVYIRTAVTKMKRTFPAYIREAVLPERGYGYKLIGDFVPADVQLSERNEAMNRDQEKGSFYDLLGDYYAFYLDPLGTGKILGGYVHIEKQIGAESSEMKAYAVLNLRRNEILFSEEVSNIFSQNIQDYRAAFLEYKKTLDKNDQRCTYGEGCISSDGSLAVITLSTNNNGAKWNIIVDLKEYLNCLRSRTNENDLYRGGLGLAFVSRTIHGTSCFRLGLVRKSFIKNSIDLENNYIKSKLKLLDDSKDAMWKPLKLSGWLDKLWYNWMMSE